MTSINLFYAEWCGHCQNFRPIWEEIKIWSNENNIEANEYEDAEIQKMMSQSKSDINGIALDQIDGYPTIIIIKNGVFTKVGDRSKENILNLLKNNSVQSGGGVDYKKKYLKYKTKYLKLKHQK